MFKYLITLLKTPEKHTLIEKKANTVLVCKLCAMYEIIPMEDQNYICTKCKIIETLEKKLKI